MNRLALARHGFQTLATALQQSLDERISDQAEQWLADEVCPVVEELACSATFRRHVRWSLDHLPHGSQSAERDCVERVEEALVTCACRLSSVMCPCDAGQTADADEQLFLQRLNGADCAAVKLIASKPWFDLVCDNDILRPDQELFLVNPSWHHTQSFRKRGELRIPLGDYVTRMMFARVDYWKALLDRIYNEVFLGVYGSSPSLEQARETLFTAKVGLDQACERLRQVCAQHDARMRDACLALLQAYAVYAPNATLDWLGPPPRWKSLGGIIHYCFRRRGEVVVAESRNGQLVEVGRDHVSLCDPTVLRQIAAALEDVVSLYEAPDDDGERLQWALQRARLVMVEDSPKAVYWKGLAVAEGTWDDNPREWDLLWTLARHRGRVVGQSMLMNREKHTIRSRRHRLTGLLGDALELDALIETRRGQGYLLDLGAEEVALLCRQKQGRLEFSHAAGRF